MEIIDEKLNSLSSMEVPNGVHQSVMRRVQYNKLRPVLFVGFGLLVLNFLIITWHINAKLIDAEFMDMTQDFFEVFNFNFSFISMTWLNFFEIVSPMLLLSAVLSLAGAIYTGKQITFYHFSKI